MKLHVEPQPDKRFAVVDSENADAIYGPTVATRKEADDLLKDWKAYFGTDK